MDLHPVALPSKSCQQGEECNCEIAATTLLIYLLFVEPNVVLSNKRNYTNFEQLLPKRTIPSSPVTLSSKICKKSEEYDSELATYTDSTASIDDIDKDPDFDIARFENTDTSTVEDSDLTESEVIRPITNISLSEKLYKKGQVKLARCKFCIQDVHTKNFMTHLIRHHSDEDVMQKICQYPENSRERQRAMRRNKTE